MYFSVTLPGATYTDFEIISSLEFHGDTSQLLTGNNAIVADSRDDVILAYAPANNNGPLKVVKI